MDYNLITIFTATFNRASLLLNLFESIKNQSYQNFEWVIVDDGSRDNTEEVVLKIKEQAFFDITFQKQSNQGKHIAINKGVAIAKGEAFFIVDSDDRLPENSLEIINEQFTKVKKESEIAGVVGLKCYFDKTTVGSTHLTDSIICSTIDYRCKHKIKGDRAEVLKTEVLKRYLFPKFGDEKFVPESIVWNRISKNYKMLFFSENIYECEYLEDGLSANSLKLRRKYPKGILNLYAEQGKIKEIGMFYRFRTYINFWRFYLCDSQSLLQNFKLIRTQYISFLFLPIGFLIYFKDSITIKE